MPEGFTTVVPIEEIIKEADGEQIRVKQTAIVKPGHFIRKPGSDVKSGMLMLKKGQKIRAPELGLLATVGCVSEIKVKPKVA